MIRGIHHFAVHTANLDRMLRFYSEAFGFTPASPENGWSNSEFVDSIIGVPGSAARTVMLKAGNVYLEIFEYSSPPPRGGEPLRPSDHGYTHFGLDTDDIENDYRRLMQAGMTFARTVPDEFDGIRAVYGKDPDGNVIELQQLTPTHEVALSRRHVP